MIGVIDYKAGNAGSVRNALRAIQADAQYVRCADDVMHVDALILPGVGNATATMESLHSLGILEVMKRRVVHEGLPFLGICIGMQVLLEHSEEGDADCLGYIQGAVKRFDDGAVRVPQMGWNRVTFTRDTPLTLDVQPHLYFVNSYYCVPEPGAVLATADYNGTFCAMLNKGNIYGAQYHMEKSGPYGLEILKRFSQLQSVGGASC